VGRAIAKPTILQRKGGFPLRSYPPDIKRTVGFHFVPTHPTLRERWVSTSFLPTRH